jgi:hypothetical protein
VTRRLVITLALFVALVLAVQSAPAAPKPDKAPAAAPLTLRQLAGKVAALEAQNARQTRRIKALERVVRNLDGRVLWYDYCLVSFVDFGNSLNVFVGPLWPSWTHVESLYVPLVQAECLDLGAHASAAPPPVSKPGEPAAKALREVQP